MNIHSIYKIILPIFRKRRMDKFNSEFQPSPQTKILDIGGTSMNWLLCNSQSRITLLNLHINRSPISLPENFTCVIGDGKALDYPDDSFDICYSNSVIEHLGSYENQDKFANEILRVGKRIWVQTPAKSFFIEPHLLTPFVHFFPRRIQKKILRNFTVWGWFVRPTEGEIEKFLSEIRLLSLDEMQKLFPGCQILKETFLGLTKSYIAVRK
jgi:hypothetical protein